MSFNKADLVQYRLEKAHNTFNEVKALAAKGLWSGVANRLYYSCFHAVLAVLAINESAARTHNGVRSTFFKLYIKSGILDKKFSVLYSNLMRIRQESDYADFQVFEEEDISPLINEAEEFISTISDLVSKKREA